MRSLSRAWDRILNMFARSVVRVVDDSYGRQRLQIEITKGEPLDNVERWQNYGFTSVPLDGADALVGAVGGDRGHSIVFCVDDRRYRLKGMVGGEVAIFTDEGDKIHFKRGRTIEITTLNYVVNATEKYSVVTELYEVTAPLATFSGNVDADGEITDLAGGAGSTMSAMRSVYNEHDHNENGGSGPTDPPNQEM